MIVAVLLLLLLLLWENDDNDWDDDDNNKECFIFPMAVEMGGWCNGAGGDGRKGDDTDDDNVECGGVGIR